MDEVIKDSRFSHIIKDPRFRKLPKKQVKVKIDKRFQSMFNEKKFHVKCKVDKRGRKVDVGGKEDLKRFYELSDSEKEDGDEEHDEVEDEEEEVEEECEDEKDSDEEEKEVDKLENASGSSEGEESGKKENLDIIKTSKKDRKTLTPAVKKKLKDLTIDYARGEGAIFSDSSSDEESSESEVENVDMLEYVHDWGELDKDAERTDDATNRLAVCNMNWDRLEATDLMVLFNSFLPPGGLIHSVTIYPSEFGLQRMKEEEEKGPTELIEELPEGEEEDLSQIQMEKLRKYQLNRLKYFYAVVVCDTAETADVLYKECDGLEYESSSSKLDLRFIPDDTKFDQKPRETCTALPDLSSYKPRLFVTSALTKAKVDLTWDENDPNREEIVKSIHNGNVDENNLKKYLACSSSSSESENEEEELDEKKTIKTGLGEIDKYKALLAEIENKEKNNKKNEVNLEVSWNLKLENQASEIVKEAVKEKDKKTPFQQYLEKRKEKKKKKREERKADLEKANQGSDDSAFSDDDIPSDIDLNDPYFKEELESSKNKKSSKKKKPKEDSEDEGSKQKKAELELLMLDNEPENKHFSLKKIEESEKVAKKKKLKKGKKRKAEEMNTFNDDFKIDVNDERFSALYTSHHFNIDPADPHFKATKATKDLIEEKLRRHEVESDDVLPKQKTEKQEIGNKNKSKNPELSMLVKNIKKNTLEVRKKVRHQ